MINKYLGGSPVNPAFAVGVDVEQNQTLHHVREDQLRAKHVETHVVWDSEVAHFDKKHCSEEILNIYINLIQHWAHSEQ